MKMVELLSLKYFPYTLYKQLFEPRSLLIRRLLFAPVIYCGPCEIYIASCEDLDQATRIVSESHLKQT